LQQKIWARIGQDIVNPLKMRLALSCPAARYMTTFLETLIYGVLLQNFPDGSYAMRRDSAYNYSRKVRTKDLREGAGDDGTTA
jgi:hypothetical protein